MAKSTINILVDRNDLQDTMRRFRALNFTLQKKYITPAVRDAVKPKLASLKNATPRNSGGLSRATGVEVQPPKKKGDPNKYGIKVLARIGYLRGKDPKGGKRVKKGYHAHLVESGVARQPFRGKPYAIPWASNRKYQYLAPLRQRKVPVVLLWAKNAVRGQGFFDSWWTKNSRGVIRDLKKNLKRNLDKAIAENTRAAAKRG